MPSSKPISPRVLSMVRKGDISAIGALRAAILDSTHSATEDVIDIIFQTLEARPVPDIADISQNRARAVLIVAGPALCLSMFWSILQDHHLKPAIQAAIVRNLLELSDTFLRWIYFCLDTGQPYLPGENIPGSPREDELRYVDQARLLLRLLELDDTCAGILLSSDALIDLFLELWNAELDEDASRSNRIIDTSTHTPCPIVSLGFKLIKGGESSQQPFLRRCGTRRACTVFVRGLMDRVSWTFDLRNSMISGLTETLVTLMSIASMLWSTSRLYQRRLRQASFLHDFSACWNFISIDLVEERFSPEDRFDILFPTLFHLFSMAIDAASPTARCHNWRELNRGQFFEAFSGAISGNVDIKAWDMIVQLASSVSHLLVYPRLISPKSFGELSSISAPVGAQTAACWGSFLKTLERAEAARNLLASRPPVHICDNRLCGGAIADPSVRFKACTGCSSTVYCSTSCQEQDWREHHQRECIHDRACHDARKSLGSVYSHRTRASQATLVELVYAEKVSPKYDNLTVIPIFDFTVPSKGSIDVSSYDHHLFGFDTYWRRRTTTPGSFLQDHLRSRLECLMSEYSSGKCQPGSRLAEAIFPGYGDEEAIYLTVLLKPVDNGFRSVYCVARYRVSEEDQTSSHYPKLRLARRLKSAMKTNT